MIHLIFIPIVFVLTVVKLLSDRYGLKIFGFISKITIIICVILFIYFFMDYQGFNVIEYLKSLIKI